ncbi:MAG TPA: outer membrane lipoprotein-sorting protein [Terriglobia bacterium]|nr:outer membrane lipoprotein-sorting protein [Terriglobia bacterium]
MTRRGGKSGGTLGAGDSRRSTGRVRRRRAVRRTLLLAWLCLAPALARPALRLHPHKMPPGLKEVMSHLSQTAKGLQTLSADLEYTKVTVVVDDKSTQRGQLFYKKSKPPQVLIDFKEPDPKTILMRRNHAEIYLPKINQIQEYDLEKHSELVQQFLLLGFGTDAAELEKAYEVKLTGEEDIGGDTTSVLELTPRKDSVAAQLAKVQIWISEESWLPVQQKFTEPGGDYLLTRYSGVKVNRQLPSSTFEIEAAEGATRVKMR